MTERARQADYDLVVAGASFAGLVCARTAAMRGLRVAVLDKKPEPGAGVRTTGILVKEAADCLDLPAALTRKVRGVRLYAPAMTHIDLTSPGYYFLATETAALLRWLAREAVLAGARLFFDCPFRGATRSGGLIAIDGFDRSTRFLVGADGARSAVAKTFGLGRNRRFLLGVEAEFAGQRHFDPGFLHCFLDRRLARGYIGWAVPGVGVTQVGLAAQRPYRPDLSGLIDKLRAVSPLPDSALIGRRGGLIPVGGPVRPFAAPGVLLVGDAAGLVSPLTAGGIHNAFNFGRRAAQAVSDHLRDSGPEPGFVLAREIPRYGVKSVLRRMMGFGPPDWLFDLSLNSAPLAWLARELYFHRRHPALASARSPFVKTQEEARGLSQGAENLVAPRVP